MDNMVMNIVHAGEGAARRSLLVLRDGSVLAISLSLVRYARDAAALEDPLGNGVRGALEIPPALAPVWLPDSGFLFEQSGGAIILNGGTTLLIKPFAIELYASGLDALHGRNMQGVMSLGAP